MSDRDRLLELLTDFGVTPRIDDPEDGVAGEESTVVLAARQGNVDGYSYFVCNFSFDAEGKFVKVGVWE